MDDDKGTTTEINAAAVKLPPVWINKKEGWFAQAEAQFNLRRITDDDTRYWHVVASLSDEVAERASPIIECPLQLTNTRR